MGRLIPAGTGLPKYNRIELKVEGTAADEEVQKEEEPAAASAPAAGS